MNYFWVHNKFLNSSWTDDKLFMNVYSFDQQCELFRNYWWIVHELFLFITSSWTVHELWWWTNNASILWTFHELFMNFHECSWTVHKVMNYISPGNTVKPVFRGHFELLTKIHLIRTVSYLPHVKRTCDEGTPVI